MVRYNGLRLSTEMEERIKGGKLKIYDESVLNQANHDSVEEFELTVLDANPDAPIAESMFQFDITKPARVVDRIAGVQYENPAAAQTEKISDNDQKLSQAADAPITSVHGDEKNGDM